MNTFKHADGQSVSTEPSLFTNPDTFIARNAEKNNFEVFYEETNKKPYIDLGRYMATESQLIDYEKRQDVKSWDNSKLADLQAYVKKQISIGDDSWQPSFLLYLIQNEFARRMEKEYTKNQNNTQGGITMSEAVNGKKGFEGNGYDQSRIGRYYYDGNANAFYQGIKEGTLPAVSITGAEMLPYDMISMTPNAVRYYTNGKMFTGVNQLVAQKFAHEMGFQPDQNGNINVVTYRQAGEKNLMKGQKHFPVASYDKEKNQVNYYNLYPESALIDKTKVEVKSPYDTKKIHREHREIQIEAMDENISIAEYFGKYEAATQLGATFVTTKAAIKSVQEKAEKEIAPHIKTGLTGKVYALSAQMSSVSKEEMQKVFQSMKPKAREMTMQRDQSISMN